jgi:hypothetical protein
MALMQLTGALGGMLVRFIPLRLLGERAEPCALSLN